MKEELEDEPDADATGTVQSNVDLSNVDQSNADQSSSDQSSPVQPSAVRKKRNKEKDTFKCKVCKNVYAQDLFDTHMATHSDKNMHRCHICQNEYSKKKYLQRHVRNIHTDKRDKYKCKFCDKTFAFNAKCKSHEMVHTGEKPYECDVCGKSFRAQYCHKMHMLMHADEKPYKCAHCPYACRDTSTLRKHQALHTGNAPMYQCAKCDKKYKAKWRLKVHIAEEHLGLNVRLTPCQLCDKKFKDRSALSIHVRIVHKRAKVDKCEICGKSLTNSSNMAAHLRTHSNLKPFKCNLEGCKMLFRTKGDAKKHSVIHYPRRKTPCLQCGRRFARVSSLRKHEMTQHEPKVKDTECEICGVMFYNDNYLLKHLHQKHSNFKERYECDHCGLVTMNKPSIVMHIKYTHGNEKDLKCKICKRKYKRHVYLKMHYLKTHKLRYKPIQRKRVRLPEPEVSVKEEPLDIEDHDLDGALENAEIVNAEDMTFQNEDPEESTGELSESLANAIIADNVGALTSIPEKIFDEFFIKHLRKDKEKESPTVTVIQPKEDRDALQQKRIQEAREERLMKARERAIQECLEKARKDNVEGARQNTEKDKDETATVDKTAELGKRQKRVYRRSELLLSCDVCGKECRGLAAFKGHTKTHSISDKTKKFHSNEQRKVKKLDKIKNSRLNNSEACDKTNDSGNYELAKAKLDKTYKVAQAKLDKSNKRGKVDNLKEFYDANVKDLGVEFEQFVEICKKVKKDQ